MRSSIQYISSFTDFFWFFLAVYKLPSCLLSAIFSFFNVVYCWLGLVWLPGFPPRNCGLSVPALCKSYIGSRGTTGQRIAQRPDRVVTTCVCRCGYMTQRRQISERRYFFISWGKKWNFRVDYSSISGICYIGTLCAARYFHDIFLVTAIP